MYRIRWVLIVIILLCCISSSSVYAKDSKKYIVIIVNTATIEDLIADPYIKDIAQNGIIGLMNVRSNGKTNQYKPYLTFGSGQRAEVYSDCLQSYIANKDIISLYEDITLNSCNEGNVVNPSINRIIKANSKTSYNAVPGMLGSLIRDSGYKTGLIGGFWHNNSIKSPAFFIVMDKNGLGDFGNIEGVFENNRINTYKILEVYKNYKHKADFMVIELGDIESLYINKELYSESSYIANKQRIIEKCGEIINLIRNNTDFSNTRLCIMSPFSFYSFDKNVDVLSPIIIYDGGKSKGIATSQTTRRQGIVSAVDFAPSILEYYNISLKGFLGYPIKYVPMDDNIDYILNLNAKTISTSIFRGSILKSYAILIIAILGAFIVNVVIRKIKRTFLEWSAFFLLLIPFSMLLEGYFAFTNVFYKVIFIIALNSILNFIVFKTFKTLLNRMIWVTMLSISGLIYDVLWGQNMLKYSLLSYDPIIGARFYGIGNEFMGVMVGCALIFCGSILQKNNKLKPLAAIFLLSIALLMGLPWFGANIGGLITASFGFSTFILLEHKCSMKAVLKISIIGCAAFLALVIVFNMAFKSNESHLGKMIELAAADNGFAYVLNILKRKLSMALRLMRYTIWSKVLIAMIIACSVIVMRPNEYIKNFLYEKSHLKNSYIGAIIACLVAIISNDSGIVTAAFIMLYTVFSMILMPQDER